MGKPLVDYDRKKNPSVDVAALLRVLEWDQSDMQAVFSELLESGIEESGADMITSCLFPDPKDRPASIQEVLDHPFWIDMRKHRSKKSMLRGQERVDSPSTYWPIECRIQASKEQLVETISKE
jgi:hypothetical protein